MGVRGSVPVFFAGCLDAVAPRTRDPVRLALDFELVRNGEVLDTQSITTTAFSGEKVSSFDVSNVGTGHA